MSLLWNEPFTADPWSEMRKMQRDMDRLFSTQSTNLLEGVPQGTNMRELGNWRPVVDVKSNDTNITVHAELPGVRKEDIDIDLTDGQLCISGKRSVEKKEENEKYHRTERFFGNFSRSFTVPKGITENDIKAKFDNGVLEVTLPNLALPASSEKKKNLITIQ